ncbi:MAG TPA: secretin N-terminal domain-containing protein [Bdellovibrio sp.]|nr:secretin N-terminal domain-containing protein [Bdellovibrio sp.]
MKQGLLIIALIFQVLAARAADTISFSFQNEDLPKIIEAYSKAAGQKFVIDPGVRGKATILLPAKVTVEEAFNQLSSALAVNGYAISKQGDTMVVMSARNIQRSQLEVTTEPPALKPERMVVYMYSPKYLSAGQINRDLRILLSRDGELNVYEPKNQIIITDWTSNLNRVMDLMKKLDTANSAETQKLVDNAEKQRERRHSTKEKEDKTTK